MSMATGAPRAPAFVFIFVTVMLDMLAAGIVVPILPKLVEARRRAAISS